MFRNLHRGAMVGVFVALWLGFAGSPAGAASISGCTNPADSALNQYCEVIPSATGGQTPSGGSPGLGSTLSSATLKQIEHGSRGKARAASALVALPPAIQLRRSAAVGRGPVAAASASSLPVWLYISLAALLLAMLGGALGRGWRRRRGGPGHGGA